MAVGIRMMLAAYSLCKARVARLTKLDINHVKIKGI
jgi:hypothetical protein